jgi:phosphoserine phosphatase
MLLAESGGAEPVFSGRFQAEMNIGARKAAQLAPFTRQGVIEAAYGDTAADLPMLAMSRHPVAVAPDVVLRYEATTRGWRIIEAETQDR